VFHLGWLTIGSINNARASHTASVLLNGKVLITGGYNGASLSTSELYDPPTGIWTTTGSMITRRHYYTAAI
jgi:hypothetical protein